MAKIFNNSITLSTVDAINYLRGELSGIAPFVQIKNGCVGNDSIMFLVCLDAKETWSYGIVENSRYFRLHLESDGSMEVFTQSIHKGTKKSFETRVNTKFRRCTAKTLEDVVVRVIKFVNKLNEEINNYIEQ